MCLAYIPETVMNCDDDYVNKPEKYKCLGNTIDGNIFNKHNDQEKKTFANNLFFNELRIKCSNSILP
jgi:translation elongation factor EF-Ts